MNVGSLFSGIGGFELGFEREGFETKWFIENNEYCQAVLRKNFPNTPIYGDIREIEFRKLERVSILLGGFPCQDISCANPNGEGIKGERSGLWAYYAKAIRAIRPKYAVIENVPMLANRGLNIVLWDLAENGYDAEWFCLRASDFGALHRRERLFVIAYPASTRMEGDDGCGLQNVEGREERMGTSSDINEQLRGVETLNTSNSDCNGSRENANGLYVSPSKIRGEIHTKRPSPHFITNDWEERISRFQRETIQKEQGFSWCQDVRRIEDLQERPDIPQPLFRGSRDGIPNWMDRIKCCGNAVVPQVAQFIARRIKEVENGK